MVKLTSKYRKWRLRSEQQIRDVVVYGGQNLTSAVNGGHGVLLAPNHAAHYDSAALYLAADQLKVPLYFMTAWQVFGMAPRWERNLMRRMGAFSVDRESADRQAFKQALTVLKEESHPLVIFPEGDIYHITDRVTPFREGAAAIAVAAARKSDRPVSIVPCGIKFFYEEDPTRRLHKLMSELDERLLLRPEPEKSLVDRILRFAAALLAIKEVEYTGKSCVGDLQSRIQNLAQHVLTGLECRHQVEPPEQIPDRVKSLRQAIIRKVDKLKKENPELEKKEVQPEPVVTSEQAKQALRDIARHGRDMDDLFFVMQLYSYPGDYLLDNPSIERLAETLDKFEEDVLDREIPAVRGRRRVEISFGAPMPVSPDIVGRSGVATLTEATRAEVQKLIDELSAKKSLSVPRSQFNPGYVADVRIFK